MHIEFYYENLSLVISGRMYSYTCISIKALKLIEIEFQIMQFI